METRGTRSRVNITSVVTLEANSLGPTETFTSIIIIENYPQKFTGTYPLENH